MGCLYGFAGDQVEVRGYLELSTTFTDGTTSRTKNIRYLVVNAPSAYNVLLCRPTLNRLGAIPLTRHMKMKLPDLAGKVIAIKSDQKEAKRCYENNLKTKSGGIHGHYAAPALRRGRPTRDQSPKGGGGGVAELSTYRPSWGRG